MNLAIDIGNSSVKFAIFKGNGIIDYTSISTDDARNGDIEIPNKEFINKNINEVNNAAVSSVVPEITGDIIDYISDYLDIDIINVEDLDYKLKIDYEGLVGEDRKMSVYGASKIYGPSTIVVDVGSALTFTFLDRENTFKGGMISLGPSNMLKSLSERTSQLPLIDLKFPARNVGKNTIESVNSGVFWSVIGAVEKCITQIEEYEGEKCKVVMTGGYSVLFAEYLHRVVEIDPFLVLRGINFLINDNK